MHQHGLGGSEVEAKLAAHEAVAANHGRRHVVGRMSHIKEEMRGRCTGKSNVKMDASAARGFILNTGAVTRMKHIDMRSSWIDQLRSLDQIEYERVPGDTNRADPFTKILAGKAFQRWQETLMKKRSEVP